MRKEKLHLLLTVSVLVVFFSVTLMFMGCYDINKIFFGTDSQYEEEREREQAEREVAEQIAEEEVTEAKEVSPTEEIVESKENMSFPSEPVIYTSDISVIPVTLTVNFRTTEVTGFCPSLVEKCPDWITTDGKIDLDTLELTATFSGAREIDHDGNVIKKGWFTITGKISDDLSIINGEILDEEGGSGEITLTR